MAYRSSFILYYSAKYQNFGEGPFLTKKMINFKENHFPVRYSITLISTIDTYKCMYSCQVSCWQVCSECIRILCIWFL